MWIEPFDIEVGSLSRAELLEALRSGGVLLNSYADTLLAHSVFDEQLREHVRVVARTVEQLGFADGATIPQVWAAAEEHGLALCPAVTAPYLRLAWSTQQNSTDSVLSAGRSPSGAVHVASPRLSDDVEFPRGFYLRVVDGTPWLRGYRCDDAYVLPGDALFAFRQITEKGAPRVGR